MTPRYIGQLLWLATGALLLIGCGDDPDFKAGRQLLDERDNWQAAVRCLERSIKSYPDSWKHHLILIEAYSRSDDAAAFKDRVRQAITKFPDSTQSVSLNRFSSAILGEDQTRIFLGRLHLDLLEAQIERIGEQPGLLAQTIIAAAKARDAELVHLFLERLVKATNGADLPDSVKFELNYFLGPTGVEAAELASKLEANPKDQTILTKLIKAQVLALDLNGARKNLEHLAEVSREKLQSPDLESLCIGLYGEFPFTATEVGSGWDACRSPDGSTVSVRDLGSDAEPDFYFYKGDSPLMKAGQQNLRTLAWPHFSPDGNYLYFYASKDRGWEPGVAGKFSLYRIRPSYGEAPQKLTDDDLVPTPPYFESGGTVLVVRKDVGSVRASGEVLRIDPSSRKTTSAIRIGDPISSAVFSKDGDSLLFVSDRGILKRALSGGAVTAVLACQGFTMPTLSLDGTWLLFHGGQGELLLMNRTTGNYSYLGSSDRPGGRFTPSGKLLLSVKRSGSYRIVELDLRSPKNSSRLAELAMSYKSN